MIHYHGGPITPTSAALNAWTAGHAMISFAHAEQLPLAAEVCQSFALDNGAYSIWRASGGKIDLDEFDKWIWKWINHPSLDFFLIPDIIDGSEMQNDALIARYYTVTPYKFHATPVWHLHESIDRLIRLAKMFKRVALGSSGKYSEPGNSDWWNRMAEAMRAICDGSGQPWCKLHGLRMLDPTIFSHLPLASADSCNIARNIGIDSKWSGTYVENMTKETRAMVMRKRIEAHGSATRWNCESAGVQMNFQLMG